MSLFLAICLFSVAVSVQSWGTGGSMSTLRSPVTRSLRHGNMNMRWGLKGAGQSNKPMGDLEEGQTLRDTVPFELRGFSLPAVVFSVGVLLTGSSFAGFIWNNDGGGDGALSSLGFVYGIPVFLIGLSLFYAEIKPVVVEADAAGERIWEQKKTDTLDKILQDVTRHRYGDDAHLDSTLESLGLKLPQRKFPKMQTIELKDVNGELSFTMVFESKETPFKVWNDPDRVARYSRFFGPGVTASIEKRDAEKRIVALTLVTGTKEAAAIEPIEASEEVIAPADITEA